MFIRPSQGRLTSPFGMRTHPVTRKPSTMHWGVDYGKDAGTRIVAAAAGRVTYAKSTAGYGNTVMIVHSIDGKTYETVYAHLASIGVKVGQSVKQGAVIAAMGTTGTSTGVHLHFEIHAGRWNNRFTNAKNPLHYIVDEGVKATQALLVKAGYKVAVDGIEGQATTGAIAAYQRMCGLAADGIAGAATLAALKGALVADASPIKPKGAIYLKLSKSQSDGLASVYKLAREQGVFSSAEHEADVKAGKMSLDKAIYLNALIAGAALNNGKRLK